MNPIEMAFSKIKAELRRRELRTIAEVEERRVPVNGKFVVSTTRDGGKTFEIIDEGLPKENAYDIVFRHALAIDETGKTIVMGSNTGGVWISDDTGESWTLLPERLPPVHAVRLI